MVNDQNIEPQLEKTAKFGWRLTVTLVLFGFGLLTLFLTLSVVFDWFGIREKEGNYVLFIVYANLFSGILYLIASYLNWMQNIWSTYILSVSVLILIIAYASLLVYVENGGIHEAKTLKAMVFRIGLTTLLTIFTYLLNRKLKNKNE